MSRCTAASTDRRLIYTNAPGSCEVNSHGYMDVERPLRKRPGVYRVVIIGDSVAQGYQVARADRFGSLLEGMLNGAGTAEYEVVVLARAGYSTSQEIQLLRFEAELYDPDVIVWSYCLNDPAHPVYHNANGNLGAYYYRPRSYLLARLGRTLFHLRERILARKCPSEFHALLHCVYENEVAEHMRTIERFAAQHGLPVIFVIHPVHQRQGFGAYTLADVHASMGALAVHSGFIVCDLLDTLSKYDSDDIKVHNPDYYDPWHFNELGHELTADAILRTLKDSDLLGL